MYVGKNKCLHNEKDNIFHMKCYRGGNADA